MDRRQLGRTGLVISPIALGTAAFSYVQRSRSWDPRSDEGRMTAVRTLHAALDRGINYVDTAPAYGDGHSEELVGQVMRERREDCVLASKVWYEQDRQGVIASVHASLRRLQTDHIDVMQVHGRMYTQAEVDQILHGGPMEALLELRDDGIIGHIGITTEEPWTVIPFLGVEEIEVFQIAYNIIYQAASRHFLVEAASADAGVVTMRTMTSGILQEQARLLAPGWQEANDLYEVALKFVLSDSRVHAGIVGMRWPDEVDQNVALLDGWHPPQDLAAMPRVTFKVYEDTDVAP